MLEQLIKSIVKNTVAYTNSQINQVKANVENVVDTAITKGLSAVGEQKGIILQNIESAISNNALIGTNGRLNQLIGENGLNALIGEGGLVDQVNVLANLTTEQLDTAIRNIIAEVAVGPQPLPPGSNTLIGENGLIGTNGLVDRSTVPTDEIIAGK